MNNFKKVGLTALAGSLVAVSAHAGELTVTGGANITLKHGSADSTHNNSGRGIGTDKDVAFKGTGELDNGTTFTVFTATNDSQTDLTSGYISIATPSFGSFLMGNHSGAAHYKYDEEVPQAYEQISDITSTVTQNKVGDFMDNNHITYTSPTFDLAGASITFDLGYAADANDKETGDGGVPGNDRGTRGSGQEAGVTIKYDALQIGVYGAERENKAHTSGASNVDATTDEFNGVWYAKYSMGPVSIGYSEFYIDSGVTGSAAATDSPKTLRTAHGLYEGHQMGIAFNVNENFSISYTESEETYDAQSNNSSGTETADVDQEIDAIQFAYSMGGMSVKAYQMDVTNPAFDEDADDSKVTEIALGLAF